MSLDPPTLEPRHAEELKKRAISPEFALASGVRSIMDNEARALGFLTSIPGDQQKNGLQGIAFPYRNGGDTAFRLKPDTRFNLNGDPAKYLSRKGDTVQAFLPHTTTREVLDNPKIPCVITEGEFKALAIAENLEKLSKKFAVIGLAGVNGGWHREKDTVPLPDGTHEKRSRGPATLIDDLDKIEWRKRRVYIVFDSDVGTPKHATAFKKSKYSGAMGAEHQLAELLRYRGAEVRIVEIPDAGDGRKIGADDYIARHGAHEFYKLFSANTVAYRDPDTILYKPRPDAFTFMDARDLVKAKITRPHFVIDDLLPEGGTAIIAAAPKVGKSMLALNAGKAICEGSPFLGRFNTRKGRVAYIETEIPKWSLKNRLERMGELPEGLLIHTPVYLKLNFFEDHGFKRMETGNRERVAALIEALKQQAVSLAIFDPLIHFSSIKLRDEENVSHLFDIFRGIARAVPCGGCDRRHHKKTARSQVRYEGPEDMLGSVMLSGEADSVLSVYSEKRSDDTKRYKLITETRHAEQPEPLELLRYGGNDSLLWRADPWVDSKSGRGAVDAVEILSTLQKGPTDYKGLKEKTGIPKTTLYRHLNELEEGGRIRKRGNVYYIASEEIEE